MRSCVFDEKVLYQVKYREQEEQIVESLVDSLENILRPEVWGSLRGPTSSWRPLGPLDFVNTR